MFRKPFLLLLLIVIAQAAYSQLSITYPVQRQVFQRSVQNTATITVTGTYSQPVDTIWVRFTPVQTGQGTTKFTNWTLLKANPLGGLFKGTITLEAGWYKMDLKGTLRDTLVGKVASLERVGVGEVFVIAGQSNAGGSGLLEANETAASDDRVNCANFISPRTYNPRGWSTPESPNGNTQYPYSRYDLAQFSIVEFSQLKKTVAIGPMGLGPSYWGKVGDALASKLNVPIMFFNTAWAGASVRVWRESAEFPTIGAISDFVADPSNPGRYPVGYPYANLKAVLGYYGVNMGIRAILWMEGETQSLLNLSAERNNKPLPVTIDSYKDNLEKLIKRTRSDLGNDLLPWVVARTSYSGDLDCGNPNSPPPKPSPVIVSAQNKVLSNASMFPLFPGPFTDSIQVAKIGEREQCVHFTGKGLDQVSSEWVRVLTETVKVGTTNQNFFSSIAPVVADTIPSVNLDCVSGTSIRLSLPSGYVNYIWYGDNIQDTNANQRSVLVGSGSYIARVTKANGNVIQIPAFTVKVNNPPTAPKITALSNTNFCVGTSVSLSSTSGAIYTWVNSAGVKLPSTKIVTASTDGVYQVKIVDENGCQSGLSSPVILTSKPRPQQPVISYTSSTEFCEGFSVKLSSSNTDNPASFLWSSGEIAKTIEVKKTGIFSVQTRGTNGCLSVPSDSIHTLANYTPPAPIIRNLSDSVFCDGGETAISITPLSDNYKSILWSGIAKDSVSRFNKGQITIKETELIKAYLQTSKGCVSKASNAIQIVKKMRPSVPVLDQLGTYTLRGRSTTIPSEYVWKKDGVLFPNDKSPVKDSIIKVVEDGSYTVSAKNNYKIQSSLLPLVCAAIGESKITFTTYDDKGLSIFPNPSKGVFFLDSRYDIDNAAITVYNIKGQELVKTILSTSKSIDLTTFGSGMYILRLVTSKYTFTKTLAVQ